MGQVLTNNTSLAYAVESTPGVLPGSPTWYTLEPNGYGDFGASITTVPRAPITNDQQRRKGAVVDLDAAADFDADLTISAFASFIEAFMHAQAVLYDTVFEAAAVTGTGYTIAAASSQQAGYFQFTSGGPISLVHAVGYTTAANNSPDTVKPLSADLAASGTEIPVAGLTAEASPPSNALLSLAGIRAEAGDLAITVAAGVGTLTSGNNLATNNIDFTTLGLTVGQRIHVGGTAAANRFGATASTDSYGSGRVTAIAAGSVTLDKLDSTLVTSDGTDDNAGGTLTVTDLLFGRFIRNVNVDSSEYLERTFQFEAGFPDLYETIPATPVGNPDGFEYVIGCRANQLTINSPLTDKATFNAAFVGTNAEDPVDNSNRKTNASTPVAPVNTTAFNTSTDLRRIRIETTAEVDVATYFRDLTIAINNNVSPEKVLGTLGGAFTNRGNFELDISGEALFTEATVPSLIRGNTTVQADFFFRNDDGAIHFDVPSGTLSSSGKTYPVNETTRIQLTLQAFKDDTLGTSLGVSLFPVYPSS